MAPFTLFWVLVSLIKYPTQKGGPYHKTGLPSLTLNSHEGFQISDLAFGEAPRPLGGSKA